MKVCPVCRMRFGDDRLFCPEDRALLLMGDEVQGASEVEHEPETILVFRPLPRDPRDDPSDDLMEACDPDPLEAFDPNPLGPGLSAVDMNAWTNVWFAEGPQPQGLASAVPSGFLPPPREEATDRSMRLRHVPWAVGLGLAGIAMMVLALI